MDKKVAGLTCGAAVSSGPRRKPRGDHSTTLAFGARDARYQTSDGYEACNSRIQIREGLRTSQILLTGPIWKQIRV